MRAMTLFEKQMQHLGLPPQTPLFIPMASLIVYHSSITLFKLYANFSESSGLDKRFKTKISSLRFLLQKLERFEGFAEIPMLPL